MWAYYASGRAFWVRVPKLSITFEEILSRAHRNFEVQNKVLDPSIVIINYCIIIIIIIIIIVYA